MTKYSENWIEIFFRVYSEVDDLNQFFLILSEDCGDVWNWCLFLKEKKHLKNYEFQEESKTDEDLMSLSQAITTLRMIMIAAGETKDEDTQGIGRYFTHCL